MRVQWRQEMPAAAAAGWYHKIDETYKLIEDVRGGWISNYNLYSRRIHTTKICNLKFSLDQGIDFFTVNYNTKEQQ